MTNESTGDACTLPPEQRPLRAAEFSDLFAQSLRSAARTSPDELVVRLDPAAEALTRELTARESQCCSFFTFTIGNDDRDLVLEIGVPDAHIAMLDAIAKLAYTAQQGRA